MLKNILRYGFLILVLAAGFVRAEQPWTFLNNTRYLALGDSLAAGYGANPTTQGYAYLLYQNGTFANTTNTTFANAAVPKATSQDVFHLLNTGEQPSVVEKFDPHVITLSIGGNDLLSLLEAFLGPTPPTEEDVMEVLTTFATNLGNTLFQLCTKLPQTHIYIGNLYSIQNFPVPTDFIVGLFNATLQYNVVMPANEIFCAGRVKVADVHAAFSGQQEGLLIINRNGADQFEVHPTNAGYRVMAAAFEAAHKQE